MEVLTAGPIIPHVPMSLSPKVRPWHFPLLGPYLINATGVKFYVVTLYNRRVQYNYCMHMHSLCQSEDGPLK